MKTSIEWKQQKDKSYNVDVRLGLKRIFTGQEGGGDQNADKDEVSEDRMALEPVAEHS